ncbi:unnamed protein product [Clavelina lepadiformis]|uniref:Uncharacterized protein n=1 Tax=Clavelina lepadiformis TaxID=159417 RepID=A0ABP0FKR6_CLALP
MGVSMSEPIQLGQGKRIPFGDQSFSKLQLFAYGVIALGDISSVIADTYFSSPPDANDFGSIAVIAPFWESFQPVGRSDRKTGQLCYQLYQINPATGAIISGTDTDMLIVMKIKDWLQYLYEVNDFNPTLIFKATWYKVVVADPYNRQTDFFESFPCTFQAILATDYVRTYLFYVYGDMLYPAGVDMRPVENALIGYTVGTGSPVVLFAGNYQPNEVLQFSNGLLRGTFFYDLTPILNQAHEDCWNWYLNDLADGWTPIWWNTILSCPSTLFAVLRDRRFVASIEFSLSPSGYNISEWLLDEGTFCFQRSFPPLIRGLPFQRCCYHKNFGIIYGPFASRIERFQISRFNIDDYTYTKALDGDLIPRRRCCVDSSIPIFCDFYTQRRPRPSTELYVPPRFSWGLGDPHCLTFDEVPYTFNGLGEYYLLYSSDFIIQARMERVVNNNGEETGATAFSAFAMKDSTSGTVQFEIDESDPDGTKFIVKVNGVVQTGLSERNIMVENVTLSVTNKTYLAIFPSTNAFEVSAFQFISDLKVTANPTQLQNISKGLLGAWSGIAEDDFELRNGTVLDYKDLLVTNDLDILDGKLSEEKIYQFGQSWKIDESESIFSYASDDFSTYNPMNPEEPPFLEHLVRDERNAPYFSVVLEGCTTDGEVNTQCLFDTLVTNRIDIGQHTLMVSQRAADENSLIANIPPRLNISASSQDFVDGCFQVELGKVSTLILEVSDEDGDDVTLSISASSTIENVVISSAGVLEWTPTTVLTSGLLLVQADDGKFGITMLRITVKFCYCENDGKCNYENVVSNGSTYFWTAGCVCEGPWLGKHCNVFGNTCAVSRCFSGVSCTDTPKGRECGDCPDGSMGNEIGCIYIDNCPGNCTQKCQPIVNGVLCSCFNGFEEDLPGSNDCIDIDECMEDTHNCGNKTNSRCVNEEGTFRCECTNGTVELNGDCVDTSTFSICDVTSTLNLETGILQSPNYPSNYSANHLCEATISTVVGKVIHVFFTAFVIEVSRDADGEPEKNDCPFDWVQLFDQGNELSAKLCGNVLPKNFSSNSNLLNIMFRTDPFDHFSGFQLMWESVWIGCASDPCGVNATCTSTNGSYSCHCPEGFTGDAYSSCQDTSTFSICDVTSTLNLETGILQSPNYPSSYSGNHLCEATISTVVGKVIHVFFTAFVIEVDRDANGEPEKNDCPFDWLQFDQENEPSGKLCGNVLPKNFSSNSNLLNITFRTDSSDHFSGFQLMWESSEDKCASDLYQPCVVDSTCTNSINSYSCECRQGFTGNAFLACEDVDECVAQSCDVVATCTNTIGSFICDCPEGYVKNAGVCSISICDVDNSTLTNASGVLASPNFPDHYPNSVLCSTTILAPADHVIAISFLDFQLESHSSCIYDYLDITDGSDGEVEPLGPKCGNELRGFNLSVTNSLTIKFKTDSTETFKGFRLQWTIVGIGCASDPCGVNATCTSANGSYSCQCPEGFTGDAYNSCQDLDECYSDPCDINAYCENTFGSFKCRCQSGFSGDGYACSEIYECRASCDIDNCVNIFGIWRCVDSVCSNAFLNDQTGIITSPNYPSNYDISLDCLTTIQTGFREVVKIWFLDFTVEVDESAIGEPGNQSCNWDWLALFDDDAELSGRLCGNVLPNNYTSETNTMKVQFHSDTIYTHSGFQLVWEIENHPCVPSPCDINAFCPFNDGSYQCSCKPGFTGDGKNCTDINECDSNPCDINAICINNRPSFECECSPGYIGDGFFCSIDVCLNDEMPINQTEFLSSPNFPDNYANGIYCLTTFVAPKGKSIQVSFANFSVESHSRCNYDYVLIVDGDYDEDQDLSGDRFCGSELPRLYISVTNTLTIVFKTDGSVVRTGFRLKLEIVSIFSSVISTSEGSDHPFPRGLLPFCAEAGDIEVKGGGKGVDMSQPIQLIGGNGIPLGKKFFSKLQLFADGVIVLGDISSSLADGFFKPPPDQIALGSAPFVIISPFWDNFQPVGRTDGNTGQMCYHDYKINPKTGKTFNGVGNDVVVRVMDVLENLFDVDDFTPTFIFKATWYEVVITAPSTQPPDAFDENHCTFQAILVTDNIKTFLFYVYGDMLYEPIGRRPVENAIIGYKVGAIPEITSAGNYQPNRDYQNPDAIFKGTFFYELSTVFNQAEQDCWFWYLKQTEWPLDLSIRSCPWTKFHAETDPRFHSSIENRLSSNYDISEWLRDSSDLECFQPRPIVQLPDPSARCCYNQAGSFVAGPFASRHELFQIPRSDISEVTYKAALDGDLLPRRICCVESTNPSFCNYYIDRRPLATTDFYNPCLFAFGNGDPHIVTLDEVFYTFNGLGEYYLFYSPAFLVQSRTRRAINDKGEETKATIFSAFAVKDNTTDSGTVQFELDEDDPNGTSFIVKVNGAPQSVSEIEVTIENVTLSVVDGVYKAIFPSTNSFEVSTNLFIADLKVVVDPALQNVSKGLLGAWSGIKEDDFELRNGTVLNYDNLLVTTDLDILDEKLSERKIYDFGQTWQILESESLFDYGSNDYSTYNQANPEEPPFLEELVREQRNASYFAEVAAGCTQSGVIITQCLFDTLVTNRTDIGQQTLMATNRAMDENSMNANIPPTLNISESSQNFIDGCFQVAFGVTSTLILVASDENGDNITLSLTNASTFENVLITPDGELELTPTEVLTSGLLEVQADDGNNGITILKIVVKFCYCENNGTCNYNNILSTDSLYFQTVGCNCNDTWRGDICNISGNTCDVFRCFKDVNCTDTPMGIECGPCPNGTEGNGIDCNITNNCPGPCKQGCRSVITGVVCSCYDGYNQSQSDPNSCLDVDECDLDLDNCGNNSVCLNGNGSFSCICTNGTVKIDGECVALEETLLQCTDRVFIGLSSSDITRLEIRDDDQIIISPNHLTNGNDLPEQCITSADSPSLNLSFGDCGADFIVDEGRIEVVYVVRNLPALNSNRSIERYKDSCFNVTCNYNTSEVVRSAGIEPTIKKHILQSQLSEGNFDVKISFTDSQYNSDSVSEVTVPERLYVKLEVGNIEANNDLLKLQARSCWASPDSTTDGDPLYQIVENGCPATNSFDSPGAIDINLNYNSTIAQFNFKSFIWTGIAKANQKIFVHCMVRICVDVHDSTCEDLNCNKKRKRRYAEKDPNLHIISSKPISLIATDNSCEEKNGGCSDKCISNGYESYCKCFGNRLLQEDGKICSDPEVIRTAGKLEVAMDSVHSLSIVEVLGLMVIFILAAICAMMLIGGKKSR